VLLIDTGDEQAYLPAEAWKSAYGFLDARQEYEGYIVDCSIARSLPPLSINFEEASGPLVLSGKDQVFSKLGTNGECSCILTFWPSPESNEKAFGASFLSNFITSFDLNNLMITFRAGDHDYPTCT
jgi:hypothetical protein